MTEYDDILEKKIDDLIFSGTTEFHEILMQCESADPRKVRRIFDSKNLPELISEHSLKFINSSVVGKSYLPAPDVSYSQWWFEEATIKKIIEKVKIKVQVSEQKKVLSIGTPTLAIKTSENFETTLLDIDNDVITIFNGLKRTDCKGLKYNIADELPNDLHNEFDIVLVDPPWYDAAIRLAINRGIQAVKPGGEVFLSFPGRLTRPGIEKSRSQLIKDLVAVDHDIISIEHDSLSYVVPFFEASALKGLQGFKTISWRKGDLIIIKKNSDKLIISDEGVSKDIPKSYSRNSKEYRIFLKPSNSLSTGIPPQLIKDYSENISSRAYTDEPDLWTTSKVGLKISDFELLEIVLENWQDGKGKLEVQKILVENGYSEDIAKLTIDKLEEYCEIWGTYSSPSVLREPREILEEQLKNLSPFAMSKNTRVIEENSDGFRPPFSRDRDRLIWSSSLKRLADKTQLFPSIEDDTVRRRLTHTLEVQQLALTIGSSLGLNLDLIEASALAHDIGHTPFGHAGEHAIDKLLDEIDSKLGGFNHYEHGLDVLSYIESPYKNDPYKNFVGLNLSKEVLEAVIKHTYYHSGNQFSSEQLLLKSKHRIIEGYCHLEGQAVRIADKISYLISDIEDGLRLGALTIFDLIKCQLFHISPLFFDANSSETVMSQFSRQRRSLIKIVMEDVINSSTLRISQKNIATPDDARNASEYIINHSTELSNAIGEVWNNLQVRKLFTNRKVLNSNLLAAKIVSELVILFTLIPNLVEEEFNEYYDHLQNSDYHNYFKTKLGIQINIKAEMLNFIPFHLLIGTKYPAYQDINTIPLFDLLRSKDYVASLSDYKARKLHNMLLTNEMR